MNNICIVGGCGHVGLPLGLALASRGFHVTLVDINQKSVDLINSKVLPFKEEGAQELLDIHVGNNLKATTDIRRVAECDVVFFVTGTPVDEHHNPKIHDVINVIKAYLPYMNRQQLVVLRSTVYPGVVNFTHELLKSEWGEVKLAFCPERVAQGKGVHEIFDLPQIVSATSPAALTSAHELFSKLTKKIIQLEPMEAELAKLITNSWRYIEFSIANQFYMMVESQGLSFKKVFAAVTDEYPRAKHFTKPGLAAGPCLFKDTMQLSAFHKNNFFLGQSAMLVNEGLPNFLVDQMEEKLNSLKNKKIAILGMTFKPNNDDIRESLSYKIKKILEFKMAQVICVDPYLPEATPISVALEICDGFILGVPHDEFKKLTMTKPAIDCWGTWSQK